MVFRLFLWLLSWKDMISRSNIGSISIQLSSFGLPPEPFLRCQHVAPPNANIYNRCLPSQPPRLIPRSTRRFLILPQIHQQLPELLLPPACRTSLRPLPAQIHQLGHPLPASPTRARILTAIEEFLGFFAGAFDGFFLLGVVVFVEVVDVPLGFLDTFGFLRGGDFFAAGDVGVAFFAPEAGWGEGG